MPLNILQSRGLLSWQRIIYLSLVSAVSRWRTQGREPIAVFKAASMFLAPPVPGAALRSRRYALLSLVVGFRGLS